jgi:DNA-binding transcriptional ArsR family regulator
MAAEPIELVADPDRVRLALSPMRRRLLDRLQAPASATELASELALGRQRINYHLRALESAGLVELVEQRQRRGCIERVLAARARAFVVDPAVMDARERPAVKTAAQDRFAAGHLIDSAAAIVREVARMHAKAERQRTRLLVFTLDTEIGFAAPADFERFATRLGEFLAREAAASDAPNGRRYRVVIGAHPAPHVPKSPAEPSLSRPDSGVHHEDIRSRPRRDSRRRSH